MQCKKTRASFSKKSFTLLEVVIALLLVSLSAPLLFSLPFRLAKKEIDLLFETELQRVADGEWVKMQAKFLSQEITWQDLIKAEKQPLLIEERQSQLFFAKGMKRSYLLKKEIIAVKSKKISATEEGKLVKVKISLRQAPEKKETSFIYQICIQGSLSPTR